MLDVTGAKPWFWIEDEFPEPDQCSIAMIKEAVASHFGMTVRDLVSDRRSQDEVLPRHIAMYLAQKLTRRNHEFIARSFGRADHSMSIYACKKIKRLVETNAAIAARVECIKSKLSGGAA